MDEKKPFKREWLKEAYMIAKGDQNISPKREHVKAAVEMLIGIKVEAERLRKLMLRAYNDACAKRKAQGLPNPPPPPSLLPKDS